MPTCNTIDLMKFQIWKLRYRLSAIILTLLFAPQILLFFNVNQNLRSDLEEEIKQDLVQKVKILDRLWQARFHSYSQAGRYIEKELAAENIQVLVNKRKTRRILERLSRQARAEYTILINQHGKILLQTGAPLSGDALKKIRDKLEVISIGESGSDSILSNKLVYQYSLVSASKMREPIWILIGTIIQTDDLKNLANTLGVEVSLYSKKTKNIHSTWKILSSSTSDATMRSALNAIGANKAPSFKPVLFTTKGQTFIAVPTPAGIQSSNSQVGFVLTQNTEKKIEPLLRQKEAFFWIFIISICLFIFGTYAIVQYIEKTNFQNQSIHQCAN